MKIDNIEQISDVEFEIKDILKTGNSVLVDIKPFKALRSTYQNNYYWWVCAHIAGWLTFHEIECTLDVFDLKWDKDFVHKINKYKLGVNSTRSLSIKDFIDYMDQVNILWNEKTDGNYSIPEPADKYLERYGYAKDKV